MSTATLPLTLKLLNTCTPACTGRAWQTAPHPHQPYIATACADKTVRIYSLTSFTLLSTITGGHKRSVRSCAWKPSLPSSKGRDSVLATGSFDSTAAIWVGKPGQEVIDTGFGEWENEYDGVEEEDEDDFRFAVVLEGHDSEIKSIAWSAHGTFLATCSRDKSVWLWEALGEDSGAIGRGGMLAGAGGMDDEDNYETVAVLQEHDGDVKTVAWHPTEEQCLASGSYDEMVRIWREDADGEWGCVGVCDGHKGTVWNVEWEPWGNTAQDTGDEVQVKSDDDNEAESGPRIMSASADSTVKIWRRKPKPKPAQQSGPRMPSIIRSSSEEEEWYEDGQLPQTHHGAIYAVAWSKQSKRVASCGGDGKIVIYEEIHPGKDADTTMTNGGQSNGDASNDVKHVNGHTLTSWKILAEIEDAHGVFEVNHVCWAKRFDRARRSGNEEVIISTGDDGEVKVWILNAA